MSLLVNREVILAKIESTYNTDPTPSASTNAVLVENPSWSLEGLRMVDRPVVKANLSKEQQIYAGTLRSVSFDCEIKGSGAAGTAPEIDALLQACGFLWTNTPSTSDVYTPASSGHKSITIYYYQDGLLYKLTGCRGNVSFTITAGEKLMANFSFTGHSAKPTDSALPTATYDATVPVGLVGLSLTVGGYSAILSSLTMDMGNSIATPPSLSASDGYGEVRITSRDVQGSIDPEQTLVATKDWENDLRAGSTLAVTTGVIGSTAGNRVKFDLPAIYYRDQSPGDRESVRTLEIPFGAVESSGDDELTITFT